MNRRNKLDRQTGREEDIRTYRPLSTGQGETFIGALYFYE